LFNNDTPDVFCFSKLFEMKKFCADEGSRYAIDYPFSVAASGMIAATDGRTLVCCHSDSILVYEGKIPDVCIFQKEVVEFTDWVPIADIKPVGSKCDICKGAGFFYDDAFYPTEETEEYFPVLYQRKECHDCEINIHGNFFFKSKIQSVINFLKPVEFGISNQKLLFRSPFGFAVVMPNAERVVLP
jgi:hypothetical protein